jgi:cbb3-type cytochrome oxidase subunit 3
MVKESIADLGLTPFAVFGLLVFFGVFVAITVWTLTRRQKQVATWSSLPLADGTEPVESRRQEDNDEDGNHHEGHECQNCGNCECSKNNEKNFVSIN